MNATFDGNDWNTTMDASTLENPTEHPIKNFDAQKFTLKVVIKDLCMIPDRKDRITLGNYSFQKVGFAGKITSVEKNESGTNYVVVDTDDSNQSVKCCVYKNAAASASEFVEGSIVRVFGKLHYTDEQLEVIVLVISEIEDITEVDVFKWESHLARIEIGRGLLGLMYSNPSVFSGVKGYGMLDISNGGGGDDNDDDGSASNNSIITGDSKDPKSLARQIIDYLRASGEKKFTIDEMSTHFNVAVEKINRAVELLEQEGNVFINGEGIYGLGC
uniref:OB domain-containing protein n=1 Tax=Strongyloides venezuelensis TaxID=75913 RepID=A0A0K0G082_STRVS